MGLRVDDTLAPASRRVARETDVASGLLGHPHVFGHRRGHGRDGPAPQRKEDEAPYDGSDDHDKDPIVLLESQSGPDCTTKTGE